MATFQVSGPDTVTGTSHSDTYIVDPNILGHARIIDSGGSQDTLLVYDRPGRTAGEFLVSGHDLIWRNYQGDEVRIALRADGTSRIEFLEWQRLPEDGSPYVHVTKIWLPNHAITEANVSAVGTAGADNLVAPRFATLQDGWSDIYGNLGNDTLIGSNNHACYLYGGRGNDLLLGVGKFDDYFYGDAGNDVIKGLGGNDFLYGSSGRDKIFGGVGDDHIIGGTGSDTLRGDRGQDQFEFSAGETGVDHIMDYHAGLDKLVFHGIAASGVVLTQSGLDALVTVGALETILVHNALVSGLTLIFD